MGGGGGVGLEEIKKTGERMRRGLNPKEAEEEEMIRR